MLRFIALLADAHDPDRLPMYGTLKDSVQRRLPKYRLAFSADNVAIFAFVPASEGDTTYLLPGCSGVILGRCFQTGSSPEDVDPKAWTASEADGLKIVKSRGEHLGRHLWGRYVAFIHDSEGACTDVLRDPAGSIACFWTEKEGVTVAFSSASDCIIAGLLRCEPDLDYLALRSARAWASIPLTGLKNVQEVVPGERITFSGSRLRARRLVWDPVEFATVASVESFDQAATLTRQAIVLSVKAWASLFDRLIVNVSGGLDSSLLLCALSESRALPTISCLNFFDESPDGDEREYARLAAGHYGFPLVEHRRCLAEVELDRLFDFVPTVHPQYALYHIHEGRVIGRLAWSTGVRSIWHGSGGDQLFFHHAESFPAIDFAARHGLGLGFARIAMQMARESQRSVWAVLREALISRRRSMTTLGSGSMCIQSEFASADARRFASTLNYESRARLADLPAGKLRHVLQVMAIEAFHDPFAEDESLSMVTPLLSQPVMEACLTTPVYLHALGGVDRAVAREGFKSRLPRGIYLRTSKGGPDAFIADLVNQRQSLLRDLFLSGELVKEGILDRQRLERFLSRPVDFATVGVAELLITQLSNEIWLRVIRNAKSHAED